MTSAAPSDHALARWLLTAELGDAEGALAGPVAAERVLHKLSDRLAQLITVVGSEALLARAVHLSRTEFPFLDGAQTTRGADVLSVRIRDCAASVGSVQAREGSVAVIGRLIVLLVSFIGEDLTFRLLRDVWPQLPMQQPVHSTRKNGDGKLEVNT